MPLCKGRKRQRLPALPPSPSVATAIGEKLNHQPKVTACCPLGFYLTQNIEQDLPWWAEPYMVQVHHHTHYCSVPSIHPLLRWLFWCRVLSVWKSFPAPLLLTLPLASYLGHIIPLDRHTLNHTPTVLPMKHLLIPSLSLLNTLQNVLSWLKICSSHEINKKQAHLSPTSYLILP